MRLVYEQILLPIVFAIKCWATSMKMHYIDNVEYLKDLKSLDRPFGQVEPPPLVAGPRVIIDEFGFLRDLLTQAEEVPTDAFMLEMYGLFITHHSIRVQESGPSIADIRRTVEATWEDVMPVDSVVLVHCLKPQDSARLSPLQLIVEIVPAGVDITAE